MCLSKVKKKFKSLHTEKLLKEVKYHTACFNITNIVLSSSQSDAQNIIDQIGIKAGLYVFFVKNHIIDTNFTNNWNIPYRHPLESPLPSKYLASGNNPQNTILYIGTAKNLNQRISEHLSNSTTSTTMRLLLLDPNTPLLFQCSEIHLIVFHFDNINSKQYDKLSSTPTSIEADLIRSLRTLANTFYN